MQYDSEVADQVAEQVPAGDLTESEIEIGEVTAEYLAASEQVEAAQRRLAEAKEALVKLVEQRGESATVNLVSGSYKVTAVRSETVKIDDEALIAALGKRAWNTMTKRVTDRVALEEALVSGRFDPYREDLVRKALTIVARAPYPRVTRLAPGQQGAQEQ